MGKNIMDTQDLSEIRKMLGDVPTPADADEFDLESIIAEVEGTPRRAEGAAHRAQDFRPRAAEPVAPRAKAEPAPRAVKEEPAPPRAPQEPVPASRAPRFRVQEAQLTGKTAAERAEDARLAAQDQVMREQVAQQAAIAAAAVQERLRRSTVQDLPPEPQAAQAPPPPRPAQTENIADEPSRRAARRAEKAARKAEGKSEKKAARQQRCNEDEAYEARDPRVAQNSCARRARSLAGRSVFVLLAALCALYLSLAGGMGWPLPPMLNYTDKIVTMVLALLVLQFLAMLVGVDIIGGGLYAFFTGAPDRKTLVSFASLATLLHGLTIILKPAWGGLLPYCAISMLLLFTMMQEEKARFAGRQRAFKAAAMGVHPIGVYAHREDKSNVHAAVKGSMSSPEPFLIELEKPDTAQRFAAIYTPIILAASVIFALIVSVAQGVPSRFFWALSALLVMAAPLGVLCAAGPAYRNVSRRLLAEGAAIAGARSALSLRKTKQAVLTDSDLFPAGSITIDGVRNYGSYSAEKLLSYAAAVTNGQRLEIGRVFAESLREEYGRPVKAANVLQYESGGLSADIGGDSVLVGTAAFLMKLHVRIRDIHGVENGVFVVINNQVAGVFVLTYHPCAPSYSALHALRHLHKKPVLATRDFNITPAMVESLFELRSGATDEAANAERMTSRAYTERDTVCGILSRDGITPLTQLLHSAEKLGSAVKTNLILGAFSGVCGVLLVFYLSNLFAVEALSPKNLLLYLLLWYVPMFLMSLSTRRKY